MTILVHNRFLWILMLFALLTMDAKSQIIMTVSNIEEIRGNVFYGVYDDKDTDVFLELGKQRKVEAVLVTANPMRVEIDSLTAGNYAISIFHDLDSDGMIGKNFIGYPKEPFGFSQNVKPMFRAPKFEEAEFYYDGEYLELEIILID